MTLVALTGLAQPANAQAALSLAVESDYRFRGYSLSEGRPTATAQIGFDHPAGLYVNGSLTGVHRDDGVDLLGYQANVGFAERISSTLSIDAGVVRSKYRRRHYGNTYWVRYTEAYVGASIKDVSARVYYSPHYFRNGISTLYGEVEVAFRPARNWRLNGHAGALTYLKAPAYLDDARYDWSVSVSRQFDAVEVHASGSGGGPGKQYYGGRAHNRTALTIGASLNF